MCNFVYSFQKSNNFGIQIPGGGVSAYNGCTPQWGAPSSSAWIGNISFECLKIYTMSFTYIIGQSGISTAQQCSTLPTVLQPG